MIEFFLLCRDEHLKFSGTLFSKDGRLRYSLVTMCFQFFLNVSQEK